LVVGVKILMAQMFGVALFWGAASLFGLSLPAQAAGCTTDGWSSSVGTQNLSAGDRNDGFLVASGQCSLNVALAGVDAYLIDESPINERRFNVRFYFYLDDVADDAVIYQAMDGAQTVLQASYSAGDDNIQVDFSGSPSAAISLGPVAAGWNALDIRWESDAAATPSAQLTHALGSQTDVATPMNTSDWLVDSSRLGVGASDAIDVPTSGSIFFDAYVSRRDALKGEPFQTQTEAEPVDDTQPSSDSPVAIPSGNAWTLIVVALLLWLSVIAGGVRGGWGLVRGTGR
jgi:hypothetical protein